MIEVPGTWGKVDVGTTLLSKTGNPLVVVEMKNGFYLLSDHTGHKYAVKPKEPDAPVTLLEATPEEAELAAVHGLGAERLLDFEREKRMESRSKQWIVPAFPQAVVRGRKNRFALDQARDHLQHYHGTYAGTAENGGFKTLKQITAAHDEMHDPEAVGGVFMDLPHTHEETA